MDLAAILAPRDRRSMNFEQAVDTMNQAINSLTADVSAAQSARAGSAAPPLPDTWSTLSTTPTTVSIETWPDFCLGWVGFVSAIQPASVTTDEHIAWDEIQVWAGKYNVFRRQAGMDGIYVTAPGVDFAPPTATVSDTGKAALWIAAAAALAGGAYLLSRRGRRRSAALAAA